MMPLLATIRCGGSAARRKEAELGEELQFHLEQEARERREAGLPEDEATLAARRDLGNEARLREDVRSIWTWRPLDELSQDLRFALRTLFKHRIVAVFATLSLALGIGANTAIYSFMDAILLRSLPVGDPAALVVMTWHSKPFELSENRRVRAAFDRRQHLSSFGSAWRRASSRIRPSSACGTSHRRSCPASSPGFPPES